MAEARGVPLGDGHAPLRIQVRQAEDPVAGGHHAVPLEAGEVRDALDVPDVLVGHGGVGGDGVLLPVEALLVDGQVVGLPGGVGGLHVEPEDPLLGGARGYLVSGLGVDHDGGELRGVPGLELAGLGVDAHLDDAGELAGVVGAVEEVLPDVGQRLTHERAAAGGRRHVAVLADDPGPAVGALLPLELRRLDPQPPGALLVVAGPAELRGAQERVGRVSWWGLSTPCRGPCFTLPGEEIQLKL